MYCIWMLHLVCFLSVISLLGLVPVSGCDFDSNDTISFVQNRLKTLTGDSTDKKCSSLVAATFPPDEMQYPSVKVFLFHHDEPELLSDWIQYHGAIFGLKNLHVIDHGSVDVDICRVLALYKACGMVVQDFRRPFKEKAAALSRMMSQYNNSFLVPLDTDEFIFRPIRSSNDPNEKRGIMATRDAIMSVFSGLPKDGKKYKFHESYLVGYDEETCKQSLQFSDHREPNYRRVINHGYFSWHDTLPPVVRKTYYWSEGFISTDQGNHHGEVVNDNQHSVAWSDPVVKQNPGRFFHLFTNLSLLHYAYSSYYGQKIKYIRGAKAYGLDETTDCTKVGQGQPYCFHAQYYRTDDDRARSKYLGMCIASPTYSASTHVIRRWFRANTRNMQEILGYR